MQVLLGTRPSQPRIGHVELVARITDSVQSSARHPLLMWLIVDSGRPLQHHGLLYCTSSQVASRTYAHAAVCP